MVIQKVARGGPWYPSSDGKLYDPSQSGHSTVWSPLTDHSQTELPGNVSCRCSSYQQVCSKGSVQNSNKTKNRNFRWKNRAIITVVQLLSIAGYETQLVGKAYSWNKHANAEHHESFPKSAHTSSALSSALRAQKLAWFFLPSLTVTLFKCTASPYKPGLKHI